MKLHSRYRLVKDAELEISRVVLAQLQRGLTQVELLQILTAEAQSQLKYMLRRERHPEDPTLPADGE